MRKEIEFALGHSKLEIYSMVKHNKLYRKININNKYLYIFFFYEKIAVLSHRFYIHISFTERQKLELNFS